MTWRFLTRPMDLHPKELHMLVLAVIGALLSVMAAEILYRLVEAPSARRSAAFGRARTTLVGGTASPSVAEESR
jgi:peptidoglycan/LPS O-acetylase OafA/YrhL